MENINNILVVILALSLIANIAVVVSWYMADSKIKGNYSAPLPNQAAFGGITEGIKGSPSKAS